MFSAARTPASGTRGEIYRPAHGHCRRFSNSHAGSPPAPDSHSRGPPSGGAFTSSECGLSPVIVIRRHHSSIGFQIDAVFMAGRGGRPFRASVNLHDRFETAVGEAARPVSAFASTSTPAGPSPQTTPWPRGKPSTDRPVPALPASPLVESLGRAQNPSAESQSPWRKLNLFAFRLQLLSCSQVNSVVHLIGLQL